MKNVKNSIFALLLWLLPTAAFAQSSPGLVYGQVPTAAQWNSYFAAKQNVLGYTPLNVAGGQMLGPLVLAPSNTTNPGLTIVPGVAPLSPANGAIWTTSAGIFVQINGSTVGPLASSASVSLAIGTTPITGGTSGRILYQVGSVLGQMTTTGSGTVAVLATSPSLVTPSMSSPTFSGTVAGAGTIPNSVLVNSSITIGSTSTSLGGTSATISGLTLASPVVTGSFTATGLVGLPSLATQIANTVVANFTSGAASPVAYTMPSCTGSANALQYVNGTGITCSAIVAAAGSVAIGTTTITGGTTTRILYDNAGVLGEYTISGSGTTVAMNTAPAITGGSHVALTALGIRSTGAAFDLTIASTEVFTAGRTLTVTLNDAARTLSMNGNVTLANAFTTAGNFTLTLTTTAATNVTLPLTGTLATLAGTETLSGKSMSGSANTFTLIPNSALVNVSTTVNGQACTLGSTCTISASAGTITVGTTAIASGTSGRILYNNSAVLGEMTTTGSGTVVALATSPVFVTPTLGVALATSVNGLVISTSTGTLTIANGKTHVVSNGITLAGTDSTTWTGASANMTLAALNIASQTITGGANVTPLALSTGSITVDCGARPFFTITGSTSAWSITAPSADGSCIIKLTNAASSAVIPSFSGFTVGSNTGASLTTTGSSVFMIQIVRVGGTSFYSIFANQ